MSFTVTATQGGSVENGMTLVVKVITGAAAVQNGATAGVTSATPSAAITPQAASSLVYGAALVTSGVLAALAGTSNESYTGASGLFGIGLRSTAVTGEAGSPVTYGEAGTTHGISVALAEILASGTLAEDASSPAAVAFANVETQTTAAFSPPAGALLVAMIATNGNTGVVTMALTDTSGLGLTWTPLEQQNAAGSGYSGVWAAQLPAPAPAGGSADGYFRARRKGMYA